MFEFKKLCDSFEEMSTIERSLFLAEKSATVLAKLSLLCVPEIDPVSVLAGFLIGSAAVDGKINEKEYLMIYPSLVRIFGDSFDYNSVKKTFGASKTERSMITVYTKEMIDILDKSDDSLKEDIFILCLCAVSIDGKVSPREKRYIRRIFE